MLFGAILLQTVPAADLVAKMKDVSSYQYRVTAIAGKDKRIYQGEYADATLHTVTPEAEYAISKTKRLTQPKGGEWEQLPRLRARAIHAPHEWVAQLAALSPNLKKVRSDKVQGVTVDVWVYDLETAVAQKAMAISGLPGMAELLGLSDGTKTKNGLLYYVGRADKLVYRVELRADAEVNQAPVQKIVTLDFTMFNRAKLILPPKVLEMLGR